MYVYRCDICKTDEKFPIQPLQAPQCRGPERTHNKEMKFVPEKSTDTPRYLLNKKEKK